MEMSFTKEDMAFRDEVRAWIKTNLPAKLKQKLIDGEVPNKQDIVDWHRKLNAKGWAVPHWPVEWGGQDWSTIKRFILREELEAAPAPLPNGMNTNLCGPVVAHFGTEEQKKRFLPRMANLDDWWCQGFSEPGSGSDLASLRTRATREGDHYIVNGSKMWTTNAQYADWMFLLVRTDPKAKKQEGISFLLMDMKSPGVTVRPVYTMEGGAEVNECFFEDVKVPVDQLIGKENRGWDCAKFLLGNERTGASRIGSTRERLKHLRKLAMTEMKNGKPIIEDPSFRSRLTSLEVEAKAHEITTMRVLDGDSRKDRGDAPNPLSSLLKLRASEIRQELTHLYVEVAGPAALRLSLTPEQDIDDVAPDWAGLATATYLNNRKVTIYGGTSEVQHNILAKAVLGL
jgi:alkylation response protein AidB-like acyl-CoA dehydrogenase